MACFHPIRTGSSAGSEVRPAGRVAGVSEVDLGDYAHRLQEEVRAQAETEECDLREAFTQLVLDQFCADGHAEDAIAVHVRDHGVEVDG